jgi:hypothetical protein
VDDLGDQFREPNGPAYVKREEREGPALSYVQEKIANSLRAMHDLARSLVRYVPDDLPAPNADKGNAF